MDTELLKYLLLGIGCLAYGTYTIVARRRTPDKFWKLEPMKKFWGEKRGNIIHIVGYTVMPLIFGVIFLTLAALIYLK